MPPRFQLSPSIIAQTSLVSEIKAYCEIYPVIFLKGAPLFGKTTLLTQTGAALESLTKVHWIEIRAEMDLAPALSKILQAIHENPTEAGADILTLQEKILSILESEKSILLIDNLDHIRSCDGFFEFLIKNLRRGKIIATGAAVPVVDPIFLMDFKSMTINGLSEMEILQLIEHSKIPISSSYQSPALIRKIFQLTSGNPFLAKLILSRAVLEQRPLLDCDVERDIFSARKTYLSKVFEPLELAVRNQLLEASKIKFATNLECEILKSIPMAVFSDLVLVGFCTSNEHGHQISALAKEFLNERYSSMDEPSRRTLLKRFSDPADYESKKEFVHQSNYLKDYAASSKVLEEIAEEMLRRGDTTDIIEFTNPIVDLISNATFNFRHWALLRTSKNTSLIDECSRRISTSTSDQEKAELKLILASVYGTNMQLRKSVDSARQAIELSRPLSLCRFESLIFLAKDLGFSERDEALKFITEAEALLEKIEKPSDYLMGQFHFAYSRCHDKFGDNARSLDHLNLALDYFRKAKSKAFEIVALSNICTTEYDLGFIQAALEENEKLIQMAEKFSVQTTWSVSVCRKARHLIFQGRLAEAERLLSSVANVSESVEGYGQIFAISDLAWIHLKTGDYSRALKELHILLHHDGVIADQSEYPRLFEMRRIAEAIIHQDFLALANSKNPASNDEMNLEAKVFINILHLELGWLNFSIQGFECIPNLGESDFGSEVSMPYRMILRCLSGLNQLLNGEIHLAEEILNSSIEFFKKSEYFIWEFRSLLAFSILDIYRDRPTSAHERLKRAHEILSDFDSSFEVDLFHILRAVVAIKMKSTADFRLILNAVSEKSPYRYFVEILLMNYSPEYISYSKAVVANHQRKFFDKILSLLGIDAFSMVRIQTRSSNRLCLRAESQNLIPQEDGILYYEVEGVVRVGTKEIQLKSKEVLGGLLKLLLSHPKRLISKDEIVSKVWREKYSPLMHDSRLYTALSRLRKMLPINSEIVESVDGRYRLSPGIKFALITIPRLENSASILPRRSTNIQLRAAGS